LKLFNTSPENVRLYQALFSDVEFMPGNTKSFQRTGNCDCPTASGDIAAMRPHAGAGFRRPTVDERRLLLELARIALMTNPEAWLDTVRVREMNDGGMGSLELMSEAQEAGGAELIVSKGVLQFTDEDGVEVVATLNAAESGAPLELDVWKTDFSALRRIPTAFRRVEE
jgi:hypothetical protein